MKLSKVLAYKSMMYVLREFDIDVPAKYEDLEDDLLREFDHLSPQDILDNLDTLYTQIKEEMKVGYDVNETIL